LLLLTRQMSPLEEICWSLGEEAQSAGVEVEPWLGHNEANRSDPKQSELLIIDMKMWSEHDHHASGQFFFLVDRINVEAIAGERSWQQQRPQQCGASTNLQGKQNTCFCIVTPWSVVKVYPRFGGIYCLPLRGGRVNETSEHICLNRLYLGITYALPVLCLTASKLVTLWGKM
jgi:hypothetical protein